MSGDLLLRYAVFFALGYLVCRAGVLAGLLG